ncbi:MAG: hypothetical protein Q8M09_13935 [Pseudomonadota bacterium]|nr:hypothetical protein [Pseudomonadota bacterium]MDP1573233.1 hypothetical protein [Pseudomonadota bacterium]MDP1905327.1 hypothetical protein [Pseudomonadota bacterium]
MVMKNGNSILDHAPLRHAAQALGAVLVTDNVGEFSWVEGLLVDNWLA